MTDSAHSVRAHALGAEAGAARLRILGATSVTIVRHMHSPQRAEFLNLAMNGAALVLPSNPTSVPAPGEYFRLTLRREGARKALALEAQVTDIDRGYGRVCVGSRFASSEGLKGWLPNHIWNHLRRRSLFRVQPLPGELIAVSLLSRGRTLTGNVLDISVGGVLAVFPGVRMQELDCGQRVELHLRFPQRAQLVRVSGSSVRCSQTADGLRCGIVLDCSAVLGWHTAEDAINAFLVSRPSAGPIPEPKHPGTADTPWSGVAAARLLEGLEGPVSLDRPAIDNAGVGESADVVVERDSPRRVNSPLPIIQFNDRIQRR